MCFKISCFALLSERVINAITHCHAIYILHVHVNLHTALYIVALISRVFNQWLPGSSGFQKAAQDVRVKYKVIILQVRGRSAGTVVSKLSTPKSAVKTAEGVPKEYDIIEEVITLLGRMESDRLSTQDGLVNERERVQFLRNEIDDKAYKRMHDLPLAVQKGKRNTVVCEKNILHLFCITQPVENYPFLAIIHLYPKRDPG